MNFILVLVNVSAFILLRNIQNESGTGTLDLISNSN